MLLSGLQHIEQLYEVCEGTSVRLPHLTSEQCGPNHGYTFVLSVLIVILKQQQLDFI